MCRSFSHNFKNITQKCQNQSCDTIALKRRIILLWRFSLVRRVLSFIIIIFFSYFTIFLLLYCGAFLLLGGFRKYDYGTIGNNNHYGQSTPPDYNFANVDVPVALYWGPNDWLATPEVTL